MSSELELTEDIKVLLKEAFEAGQDSIGWRDDQFTRVDYIFDYWLNYGRSKRIEPVDQEIDI